MHHSIDGVVNALKVRRRSLYFCPPPHGGIINVIVNVIVGREVCRRGTLDDEKPIHFDVVITDVYWFETRVGSRRNECWAGRTLF